MVQRKSKNWEVIFGFGVRLLILLVGVVLVGWGGVEVRLQSFGRMGIQKVEVVSIVNYLEQDGFKDSGGWEIVEFIGFSEGFFGFFLFLGFDQLE